MKNALNGKITVLTLVLFIITGLYIAYIWFHSFLNAEVSTVESTTILDFLINILKSLGISAELTDHIVRKAAHFCEFALLGLLTGWCAYSVNGKIIKNLMSVGFVCLLTAVTDEIIQMFSVGRSSQVSDVLLDFCGSVSGLAFFIFIVFIISLFRKVRKK